MIISGYCSILSQNLEQVGHKDGERCVSLTAECDVSVYLASKAVVPC